MDIALVNVLLEPFGNECAKFVPNGTFQSPVPGPSVQKAPILLGKSGGRTRTRTWDPLIKSQLLYQLSYAPSGPLGAERGSKRAAVPSKGGPYRGLAGP